MVLTKLDNEEKIIGKKLYDYQHGAIDKIFERINDNPNQYNLLYQLPTGGGKTVIFSEIARRYIKKNQHKVLILTHRIELSKQTSNMLTEFGVNNKVIDSSVKEVTNEDKYSCFVAMVETLNNRIKEEKADLQDIGLVIVDEAHYNSFRKLFKHFENCFILGVTATPLSSNINLPMHEIYKDLIVGEKITSLIEQGFLAQATTYSYNVNLSTLKIGANGDYTVKSSEELYTKSEMQSKLVAAYEATGKNKKTLIFNNGIHTSRHVYEVFKRAGYKVNYIDNTNTKEERKAVLSWFKNTPDAILTSVGILTTGFDEPTIDSIIINRATKSLALYFQMIGRGSRVIDDKKEFSVLDLGNNVSRFGLWTEDVDWQLIFKNPSYFLENLISDDEIERNFKYEMPEATKALFSKSTDFVFDVKKEYDAAIYTSQKSKIVLEKSIAQHAKICAENSEDVFDAHILSRELNDEIEYRIKQYSFCILKSSKNYLKWLEEDYKRQLRVKISILFR
ncbi:DEAD/DEAH box helicase family protein [Lutimonas halocynthiae]|uniref:DEAD/DEAH box helicase n=1 Tax=Lutimonas halocynthiae TaxID=1446477 RepID=UPI0025B31F35|nr:DEAD/DEAH box helicase family protein [Lutimonas halocynthiae]MDN3644081.1 DEAD/DEAH box helicase family protein [Lutimonas halocynthiae]